MAIAQIQIRRGTTAEWAAAYPVVLAEGEPGYDTTLKEIRIGDGTTAWDELPRNSEITVKSGGTPGTDCDYVKLTDAMAFAYATGDITVIILAGTYNIVTELSSMAGSGPLIGNGMHLIFSPQAYVTCNYTGGNATIESTFSPFNAGDGDFIIENMNISCSNVRYCVHDELNGAAGFRRHTYKNCRMYIDNRTSSAIYRSCIGGGLGEEEYIIIEGGYYKSEEANPLTVSTILYHNGPGAGCKSEIVVKDVFFDGGNSNVRFGYNGASTAITDCFVSNCRMQALPVVTNEDGLQVNVNMRLIKQGIETTPIAATLLGSWVNWGSGTVEAGYYLSGQIVHVQGLVKSGTGDIMTLPVGMRPSYSYRFAVPMDSGTANILVEPDGSVSLESGDGAFYDLSPIQFTLD